MELIIKQLKQNEQIFVPQTTSEAVLVKDGEQIITLDKMLDKKLESIITPVNSGLNAYPQSKSVVLTHSNSIEPNENPTPLNIKYDNRGHIVETSPQGKIIVTVNKKGYIEYNGQEDRAMLLGDDFGIDEENNIILKWNNL